jgi:iron complex outermembrane receptor protein
MSKLLCALLVLCLASLQVMAQSRTVSGTVTGRSDGSPIPGASVIAKGSTVGTATDNDGRFTLSVPASTTVLTVSSVGYTAQDVSIEGVSSVTVLLDATSEELGEVVVTVGRGTQRTFIDTPLPVDNLTARDLSTTGQLTFDKALQYRVPSFNSINTPVNDATTLLDPYEIRNLGPSRTLILINGKRKNLSSLLYVQFSPGRGETGADLSGIPSDAIKRVEILRDGASAQYGSDAIAGVMNVILKDKFEYTTLNVMSGVTSKGDGGTYGLSLNSGSNFGKGGFVNYTIGISQTDNAVRSGIIDRPTEKATFGEGAGAPVGTDANIDAFLNVNPTGGNINGTGETSAAKFLLNWGIPMGEKGQLYGNGAFVTKKVLSNANYRTPYWKLDYGLLHSTDPTKPNYTGDNTLNGNGDELYRGYMGYMPTFEGDLLDYNATLGVKNESNGWIHDVSFTVGGNKQLYSVNNTVNHSLGASSPTNFKPGGYEFDHQVFNVDVTKAVTSTFNVGFGVEARNEIYEIIAGDTASYSGEGANSFPGIRAENARSYSRFNMGAYLDATWDITENFLIQGTYRAERYSDFGNASVWKVSSRYKLLDDKLVIRGSVSTGFRAPTLHQIYAQSTQASFANNTIVLSGLFNNISKEAFALGIPKLTAEKSDNYTIGAGFNVNNNLSFTLDYYSINIRDRIVYSSSIKTNDPSSQLGQILAAGNLTSVQFFINGVKTRTEGLDFVASYKGLSLGKGTLGVNLAGNWNILNKVDGSPNTPPVISAAGGSILNAQVISLMQEGRPLYKAILGLDYSLNKFNIVLNNTLFGPTGFQDLDNGGSDMNYVKQQFKPGVVTDLNIGYAFTSKLSASVTVNNLFNVLPKWELKSLHGNPTGEAILANPTNKALLEGFLAFSGRYNILGYNGSQFSQLGTTFMAQLSFKF